MKLGELLHLLPEPDEDGFRLGVDSRICGARRVEPGSGGRIVEDGGEVGLEGAVLAHKHERQRRGLGAVRFVPYRVVGIGNLLPHKKTLPGVELHVHSVIHGGVEVHHEFADHRVVPTLLHKGSPNRRRAAQDRIRSRQGKVLQGDFTHTHTHLVELARLWNGGMKLSVEPLARDDDGDLAGRGHERGGNKEERGEGGGGVVHAARTIDQDWLKVERGQQERSAANYPA